MKLTLTKQQTRFKSQQLVKKNNQQPDFTSFKKKNDSIFNICCDTKKEIINDNRTTNQQNFKTKQKFTKKSASKQFDSTPKPTQITYQQIRNYSSLQNNKIQSTQNRYSTYSTNSKIQQSKHKIDNKVKTHFQNYQKPSMNKFQDKIQYENKNQMSRQYSKSLINFMPNSKRYQIQKSNPNTLLIKKVKYNKDDEQPLFITFKRQVINNKQVISSNLKKLFQLNSKEYYDYKQNSEKKMIVDKIKNESNKDSIYTTNNKINQRSDIKSIYNKVQDVNLSESEVRQFISPKDFAIKINKQDQEYSKNKQLHRQNPQTQS